MSLPFKKVELIDYTRTMQLINSVTTPVLVKKMMEQMIQKGTKQGATVACDVQYAFSKNMKDFQDGRIFTQGSHLQNLKRDYCNFICSPFYKKEVDMVNALPTILWNLASIHSCKVNSLSDYIKNRDIMLKSSGLTKQKVLSAFLDSKLKKKYPQFVTDIHNFIYGKLLCQLKIDYPAFYTNLEMLYPNHQNIDGKFISAVCFSIESELLLSME